MNRRITKTMADEAAKKMKERAYSKKIDEAYEKLDAIGEELVRKYIPAPVIACVNEYGGYFGNCTCASITAIKEHPEAMKYLVFPEVKAVPMPVFSGLREIIGSIKEG